jgi:hypothetical protein
MIAHLKTIGTMLAIVGVLTIILLLPQTVLLASVVMLYWVLYKWFNEK